MSNDSFTDICNALSGLTDCCFFEPRAMPLATMFGPFGAKTKTKTKTKIKDLLRNFCAVCVYVSYF